MKYEKMSHSILAAIGGVENISSVAHCATRLRIDVKKLDAIDLDAVKKAEYALGAVVSGGQLQVIIGPNVTEAYNDFLEVAGIDFGAGVVADDEGTIADMAASVKSNGAVGIVEKFGNITAQIFMPIVPALIVGGLILAIKNLLVNTAGLAPIAARRRCCWRSSTRPSRSYPSGLAISLPPFSRCSRSWARFSARSW